MDIQLIATKLRYFYNSHKRMPTHGEMVKLFHYSSRGSTHYLVKRLIQEGLVEKDEQGKLIPKNLFSIPLLGVIKAGYPIPADAVEGRSIMLYELFADAGYSSFALTVSGDSMIDACISDGDIVIVNKNKEVRNGDIVAACVDGEWTVKYFQKNAESVVLLPGNNNYKPIYPKESLTIGGVVIHVIRSYK